MSDASPDNLGRAAVRSDPEKSPGANSPGARSAASTSTSTSTGTSAGTSAGTSTSTSGSASTTKTANPSGKSANPSGDSAASPIPPAELEDGARAWLPLASGNAPKAGAKGAVARRAGFSSASTVASGNSTGKSAAPVLNFEEALAQSLGATTAEEADDSVSADASAEPADSTTDQKGSAADPAALALALTTQSLASALGIAVPSAPISSAGSSAASQSDGSGSTSGIGATTSSPIQQLVQLLSQDAAASAKAGSDTPQADATAPKQTTPDGSAANAAPLPPSLGVSSHFSLQSPAGTTSAGELRQPVGTQAWNDELGTQMTWMAHQGVQSASLQLSPEHLGPLEVHISVQDGNASVWFGASQADTRAALEQALPRLREMFAMQGLTLADSSVSQEPPRNRPRNASQGVAPLSAIGDSETSTSAPVRMSLGLIDTYV